MASTQKMQRIFARGFSTTCAVNAKVGFIGLGNMGKHMASNLLKKGHQLTAFDVNQSAVQELVGKGATAATTIAEAARNVDVVITMLPSSPHVQQVYNNSSSSSSSSPSSVFAAANPGTLLLDCSTIDPNVSRSLSVTATERGFIMLDAPVSGGVGGAEAGTLTFMVGAPSPKDFTTAQVILQCMGKSIVHTGGVGTGQIAKLCNNLVLGVSMNAVSEAMNLGVRLGADPKVLASIINTSSGRCWSSDTYNPVPGVMPSVPSSRGYTGGFGSALMMKDLGLALEAAKSAGAALPTASAALSMYALMCAQGWAGKDFSAVYAFLEGKKQ